MGDNEYLDDLRKQESEIAACWNLSSLDQRHIHFHLAHWYHHDSSLISPKRLLTETTLLEVSVSCFSL